MTRVDAVYARQSVEKMGSLSISGQIELCRKAAGSEKLEVYQDQGYSGKNTDRPDFQRLLKDIKADKIGTLYVYRLDRFSRSVADFGQLWEILQAHKVEFVSVNESFDTKTPMGRAMLHIIMVFAQLERETTAERVKDNYYRRAALGHWPGGPAPFGYDNARTPGGVPTLIPNENAAVVQRIFQEYAAEDMSLGRLARLLNDAGVHGVQREGWDNVMLSRVLHNPTYVRANEDVRLFFLAEGAQVVSAPEAFDGEHAVLVVGKRESNTRKYSAFQDHTVSVLNSDGIIDPALWLACQNKLARNTQLKNTGKGKHTWLSGLMKCASCGYSAKVTFAKGRRYLLCSGRYNLAKCDATLGVTVDELEQSVEAELIRLLAQCPAEKAPAPKDDYAERLRELDRRADRLLDAFAESEDLDRGYLKRALRRIEDERMAIRTEQQRDAGRSIVPEHLDFSSLDFEEKKAVAAQFIERIEIGADGAEIKWKV